jgi:hypothetical protein
MRAVQHYYNVKKVYKYIFITYLFLHTKPGAAGLPRGRNLFGETASSGSYLTKKNK